MKKLTPIKLALTFAGCFLGAGYVSGQELWQFFGVLAAVVFLFFMAVLLLRLSQDTGIGEVDKLVICWDVKFLRVVMAGLELAFLFGIGTIMAAGVGALLNQLFVVPTWVGCAVFAGVVAMMAMTGLKGLVSAFSVSVPILAAATVVFGVVSVSRSGMAALPTQTFRGTNPMMPVWIIGALTFACYNIFGNFAVLTPFAKFIPDKKTAYLGVGLGASLLLLIALGVMASLCCYPAALDAQLPMLSLASNVSPALGYGYGLLLLLAMFGTSLSAEVAFIDFVCQKSAKLAARRKTAIGAYGVLMFAGSLAGFGDLIGTVYPVFGYLSSVFVVLLVIHWVRHRRAGKSVKTAEKGVIS